MSEYKEEFLDKMKSYVGTNVKYKVTLELGLEQFDDQTNPVFDFFEWEDLKVFVDICMRNGYDVKILSY